MPQARRAYPNRVSSSQTEEVIERIRAGWDQDKSVGQSFFTAWDGGQMLCSKRSWYRIAARLEDTRPGRGVRPRPGPGRRAARPARPKPVLEADGPGQVWSWDITDLPSTFTRVAYKLYAVMDIYGRPIIAHRVEEREADHLAVEMFAEAIATHGPPRVVHSDSGPAMRSNRLRQFLTGHGVEMSFIRPRVSNDNPFSESVFSMLKTRPSYPTYFSSLEQARAWADGQIREYNTSHHHSGLAGFTPEEVTTGQWALAWRRREAALEVYYTQHPERFHARPSTPRPPMLAGINHLNEATTR